MIPLVGETQDSGEQGAVAYRVRTQDAASLILIDRSRGNGPYILMGRRASGHVFMPGVYVFPGGRRDPSDHCLPYARDLDPQVLEKLMTGVPRRMGPARARALALAALRELREETGIRPAGANGPDLSMLRYVARAITPPGNVRRYDTRFFLGFCEETVFDMSHFGDTDELEDLQWLDIAAVSSLKLARITQTVLEDVKDLMKRAPSVPFGNPVPFYSMRRGRFVESRL
ncbi:NUDIX domain-containing protein [Aliirhizobium smilacinae]|uniref:NUDIX domain-containing protein n=1 Tax=Aliirhizobium smilacinae TaxID=1395944 RepID=A0A5C4XPK8_9HYPH|nr:NUDIX domain-containing protein [Rhizobium smilacinae]